MNLRTYPDPPTVMEVERTRLQLRRRMVLTLVFLLGLVVRSVRTGQRS